MSNLEDKNSTKEKMNKHMILLINKKKAAKLLKESDGTPVNS